MADDDLHPEDSSEIKPISIPVNGFSSTIPSYLLEGKTESEQYLLNEVSKMSNFISWCAPILVSSNLEARRTNGRVRKMWAIKEMCSGYKGFIAAAFAIVVAISGAVEAWNFFTHHALK